MTFSHQSKSFLQLMVPIGVILGSVGWAMHVGSQPARAPLPRLVETMPDAGLPEAP